MPATLGPDDPSGRFPWWRSRILDGGPLLLPVGGTHALQLGFSHDLARYLVKLLGGGGTTRTIYNYAQREMPAFVNFLHLIARAAEKPLNTVAVPSHLLQVHTDLPWYEWSYAPFSYCPILMSLAKTEAKVGLSFHTPLHKWVQITLDSFLSQPEAPSNLKHGDMRSTEIEFAACWEAARMALAQGLAD